MIVMIKLSIGLFIFLTAMKLMTTTLQKATHSTLQSQLTTVLNHPLKALSFSACFTALVQSSSAMSVLTISLAQAKLITLYTASMLIMGANLGTTATSLLLSFNLDQLIPYFIGIGLFLFLFNQPIIRQVGTFFASFGFLFLGLHLMKNAMIPLVKTHFFTTLILNIDQTPLLCLCVGIFITFVIQSSSASTAILLSLLAVNGITINTALFILLGHEIGTCITAILASLTLGRIAKQTALFHLLFNVIGVIIFLPFSSFFIQLSSHFVTSAPEHLAHLQIMFNVFCMICLFPFIHYILKIITKVYPDRV